MPDFTAPLEVTVERGRVWIKRAHQSFMLAYDDTENMEWYAAQLRRVLTPPSAQDWLKERAPDQHAAWAAGNATAATVDWMAGWEACRAAAAGVGACVAADDSALLDHIQCTGSTVELLPGDRFRIGGLHAAVSTDLRAAIRIAVAHGVKVVHTPDVEGAVAALENAGLVLEAGLHEAAQDHITHAIRLLRGPDGVMVDRYEVVCAKDAAFPPHSPIDGKDR